MEQVEVDALRTAYQRAGAGPPLVLLHGYVGDGSTTWRRQLDGLCDEFTAVAWDAPGAGGSADPPESFGLAGYADCLAGFVDELGLGTPHVAGLSFGGILALELYRRHPTIPSTLILASAYAGWGGSLPADIAQQRLQQALGLAELSPEAFVGTLLPTMFSQTTPPEAVEAFGTSMLAFHPAGFRAMARASAEDLRDVLPHINVPTLLVYGDKDVRAPLPVAEDLHAAIPGSTLLVVPDARASVQHRSPGSIQPGSPELSPRDAQLTIFQQRPAAPRPSSAHQWSREFSGPARRPGFLALLQELSTAVSNGGWRPRCLHPQNGVTGRGRPPPWPAVTRCRH